MGTDRHPATLIGCWGTVTVRLIYADDSQRRNLDRVLVQYCPLLPLGHVNWCVLQLSLRRNLIHDAAACSARNGGAVEIACAINGDPRFGEPAIGARYEHIRSRPPLEMVDLVR
jgi:hypothetical protein